MPVQTLGPYRTAAAFLRGLGLFCVVYSILVKVFGPYQMFSGRHLAFLIVGAVLLAASGILSRVGRTRD